MSAEKFMTKEGIAEHLDRDIPLYIFDTIDSTNTYAKMLAAEGAEHGTTVIALQQTGGRGRLGRSFHAPPGTGIYMSIVLKTESDFSKALMATTAASVAVCRAVSAVCSAEAQIKWVNDIYSDGKKCAGILCESVINENGQMPYIVVGIGVNLFAPYGGFSPEIKDIAINILCLLANQITKIYFISKL